MKLAKNDLILVVEGGPSSEAEVSRRTGAAITKVLCENGYRAQALEFVPVEFLNNIKELAPKVVFNAVHGRYGEDGAIPHLLEIAGIPYTGSGPVASAITMDKVISKRLFLQAGIPTARSHSYSANESADTILQDIKERFTLPVVIKAANQGSTIGIRIVYTAAELPEALADAFSYDGWILVEKYLGGDEFTVAVLDGEALPVIQIVPHSGVYDYTSKYSAGATDYLVPAPISDTLTRNLQDMAFKAVKYLGCCGVARVDFMTDEQGNPYALEVNTVPGMTETSLVPKAAGAAGVDFLTLCERILATAGLRKL